jgi:glycerol-3-phosphate dehydrogenase subunit C
MDDLRIRNELDKCIKCGICTANCPVARASVNFAGPKHMGPEMTRFRLDNRLGLEGQVDYCCDCRNCEQVCPSGVKISLLNAHYKQQLKAGRQVKLRDRMLSRPGSLAKMSNIHTGMSNFMLRRELVKAAMDKTLGISKFRSFPAYSNKSFVKWFKRHPVPDLPKQAVYFVGCSTNFNEPETGKSVVRILEHNGYRVIVPPQGCCGLPLAANGFLDEAAEQAKSNLEQLLPYVKQGLPVIAGCSSCSLSLKSEYNEFYHLKGAKELGEQVYDFSEFLRELYEKGELQTDFQPLPMKVAYHTPCHLKAQGIGQPALELLRLIPELQVVEVDEGCCGMSGSYGFKTEKYDISLKIGRRLFDRVKEIDPEWVATDCSSCGMQINHGKIGRAHV